MIYCRKHHKLGVSLVRLQHSSQQTTYLLNFPCQAFPREAHRQLYLLLNAPRVESPPSLPLVANKIYEVHTIIPSA